jgi:membrane-bound metal-dependent hydrolase YbcI (DUF457 family)
MAGYRTHFGAGLVAGAAFGGISYFLGTPLKDAGIATTLFVVASIFPDADVKSHSRNEIGSLIALGIAIFCSQYFQDSIEIQIVLGIGIFLVGKKVFGEFFKVFRHRGILHSILAAVVASGLTLILVDGKMSIQLVKAFAVFCGYITHLIVDDFTTKKAGLKWF